MRPLTKQEHKVLAAVAAIQDERDVLWVQGRVLTERVGSPPEGIHITANSLCRKGMFTKRKVRGINQYGMRGYYIAYAVTDAGRKEIVRWNAKHSSTSH